MSDESASQVLDRNIDLIQRYLQSAKDEGQPTALLMGAGASISAGIPLADGFVKIINDNYDFKLVGATSEQRKSYQYCMWCLPLSNRKAVIKAELAKARLNWGHIALAQLIKEGYFSRILTFNFDQLLEQSLSLLGQLAPVYDFGTAPSEETEYIAEPAIIHLHGQGYGIKLIHDQEETDKHIEKLRPVFQNTIQTRDFLVIGYSGDSDPYLQLLNEFFKGDHELLWLNYGDSPGAELDVLRERQQTRIFNCCDFDQIMIGLAKKLGVWPPEFVNNPLSHINVEISQIADYPLQDDGSDEVDILGFLKKRLEVEIPAWDEKTKAQRTISEVFHRPNDDGMIYRLTNLLRNQEKILTDDMKDMAAWAFILNGNHLSDQAFSKKGPAADRMFEKSYQRYQAALDIKPDHHSALYNWGTTLSDQAITKQGDAADDLFRQAYDMFRTALKVKPDKYQTLYNWGIALTDQAQKKGGTAAEELLQKAIEKFRAAIAIRPNYQKALNNCGNALLGQALTKTGKKAEDLFDQAESMFNRMEESGLYNMACVAARRGQNRKAISLLNKSLAKGRLPEKAYLEQDTDLDGLRKLKSFQNFMANLPG